MHIILASDHAGFELKAQLADFLRRELSLEPEDYGAHTYDPDDDYTEYVTLAARAVAHSDGTTRAVVLGGSGQGEAIAANRVAGVRAAVYYGGSLDIVRLSREHNDANILSLGARFVSEDEAQEAVRLWLATPFSDEERHVRRNDALDAT